MGNETLVVVGGVAAGMSAAAKAKRENPDLTVKVYERGPHVAYGQCGLPYYLAGHLEKAEALVVRQPAVFREQGVAVHLFHEGIELDTENQRLLVANRISGKEEKVAYDHLVIATGADPVMPKMPGIHLPGVMPLKTIPDAEAIQQFLSDPQVKQVVLVGGGYINVEMAEAALARGKKVRLIQRPGQVLNHLDEEFGKAAGDVLERHGVQLHLKETVKALEGTSRVTQVVTDQGTYPADLVIIALGVSPNTRWLPEKEFHQLSNGALVTDAFSRTNRDHHYTAGDCAGVYHRIRKEQVYLPLGTTANKQGMIAGACIAGNPQAYGGILGTAIVKVVDRTFGKTGISEKEAQALHIPFETVTVTGASHAGSYPGAGKITIKLIYHRHYRTLLGAQLWGPVEGAKRLDVLAVALQQEMTVEELALTDLSYAPPYATVWDVVQVAARAAK
ncbi:CoA-disulfide reductase [Anoxynatronum sibiricum]|uniref:CoA-disulfide reductase n=1 Tax=Anoxynatronum sibiricum TaxID=210623 RepID=A0ABU9VX06_9CLOT